MPAEKVGTRKRSAALAGSIGPKPDTEKQTADTKVIKNWGKGVGGPYPWRKA